MTTTPTSGAADLPEAHLFTKKPVTISATQWFKNGDHPRVRAISPSDDLFFTGMGGATLTDREKYGVIGTLESPNHLVIPGDWIITGVAGEHYACKPDIFEATYSPATLTAQAISAEPAGAWIKRWHGSGGKEGHEGWSIVDPNNRSLVAYLGREVDSDAVTAIVIAHNALRASHGQAPAGASRFADVIAVQRSEAEADPSDAYMVGLYNGMSMMDANYRNITDWEPMSAVPKPTPSPQAAQGAGITAGGEAVRLLQEAWARMDRARGLLTDDNPRPDCNWGMLDAAPDRAQLAASPQPAPPADSPIKDHQIAALVNELRDIAIKFHSTQQLRERIAHVVIPVLKAQGADSVLEDAARLLRRILEASKDGDSDTHLSAHFVSHIETITKPGGAA